jgi:SAM-dependent methyltransferase
VTDVPDYCIERNSIVKTKMLIRIWQEAQAGPLRLLDVGCGDAEWLVPLLDSVESIAYHGIEPQGHLVDRARANLPRFASNIRVGLGEDIAAEFGQTFGLVISRAALEHVYYREAFLGQVCDAAAPGGSLLLTYGSNHFKQGLRTDLRNLASKLVACVATKRYYTAPVDEAALVSALERSGLTLQERKYYSLDEVKAAHKLVADPAESRGALLDWLALEERLNEGAGDGLGMRRMTNEAYFDARKSV